MKLSIISIVLASCLNYAAAAAPPVVKLPMTKSLIPQFGPKDLPYLTFQVPIKLGESKLNVLVDFGLSKLIVPEFKEQAADDRLHYSKGYKRTSASTAANEPQYLSEYRRCRLFGPHLRDELTFPQAQLIVGGSNETKWKNEQVKVSGQSFMAANRASLTSVSQLGSQVDGLLGLGSRESGAQFEHLVKTMKDRGLIERQMFSLHFDHYRWSTGGGNLVIGGLDPTEHQTDPEQIHWFKPADNQAELTDWRFKINTVHYGKKFFSCLFHLGNCEAKLSTAVNGFHGPQKDVEMLYELLGAKPLASSSSGVHVVDCERVPSLAPLVFTTTNIEGKDSVLALGPRSYIDVALEDNEVYCYVNVFPLKTAGDQRWLLGTQLLGYLTGVFDLDKKLFGIAPPSIDRGL